MTAETCWNCGYFRASSPLFNDGTQKTNFCRMRWDRVKDPATYHCLSWYPAGHGPPVPNLDKGTCPNDVPASKPVRPKDLLGWLKP